MSDDYTWFIIQSSGIVIRIVRIIKDIQDNPYIVKCLSKSDRQICFMSGEFNDMIMNGKLRKIK